MFRMFGEAPVDKRRRLELVETRQDRLTVCGAVKRETLADPGERNQPLTARNLIDEHRRAASENRQVDCLPDLVAQRGEMRMQDVREIGADRCGDARQARAYPDTAARLRLADEILGRKSGHDALHGRTRKTGLARNLTQAQPFRPAFERSQDAGGAGDDLDAEARRSVFAARRLHIHRRSSPALADPPAGSAIRPPQRPTLPLDCIAIHMHCYAIQRAVARPPGLVAGRDGRSGMSVTIRGIEFQGNLDNPMGLEFYNLSHRYGFQSPNWPYFEDVKIERIHYMAKSGVLSQRITTSMHNTTHIDAPAHVVPGTPFIDEVPLPHFFGSGIVVSIRKEKWEPITYEDLEKAAGPVVRPRDVVLVNTGWHKLYEDSEDYFCREPGFVPSAGKWFVEKKVKVVGHDTQANDHPLATAIGPQRNGPLHPHLAEEYKEWSGGRDWKDDFPEWEPVHRILFKNGILGIENVGGDIDKVTGKRCTFAFFPWNWDRGDGCIIRLVAIVDPKGAYRIENGEKFA